MRSLDEIASFYEQVSHGWIIPAYDQSTFRYLNGAIVPEVLRSNFSEANPWKHEYLSEIRSQKTPSVALSQDLFKFEVEKFIQLQKAEDLMTARVEFYSKNQFIPSKLQYSRPYPYLREWRSLFHPPVKSLNLPLLRYVQAWGNARPTRTPLADPDFQKRLDLLSNTELTAGNFLKVLPNADGLREKIRLVREAKNFVIAGVMAFDCSESGKDLIDAIESRARSGLLIYIMTEGFYGKTLTKKCSKRLQRSGVQMLVTSDAFDFKSLSAMYHNKIWIRDGIEAIVGGQNIAYSNNLADGFIYQNRDTDLLIQGPGATDVWIRVAEQWQLARKKKTADLSDILARSKGQRASERLQGLRGEENYQKWLAGPSDQLKGLCRVAIQDAKAKNQPIRPLLKALTDASREHIWITSPSIKVGRKLDPSTDELGASVLNAGKRGVSVQSISAGIDSGDGELSNMILNGIEKARLGDQDGKARFLSWLYRKDAIRSAKSKFKNLMGWVGKPGIQMWTYFGFMHAKTWYFDRTIAMVSSYNFDNNSASNNAESAVFCIDQSLNEQFERQLALDVTNSIPLLPSAKVKWDAAAQQEVDDVYQ